MPRHPPYALNNLTTHNNPTLDKKPAHPAPRRERTVPAKDARVHCAVLNQQTATTPTGPTRPEHPHRRSAVWNPERPCTEKSCPPRRTGPAPSGPNSVPTNPVPPATLRSTHPPRRVPY